MQRAEKLRMDIGQPRNAALGENPRLHYLNDLVDQQRPSRQHLKSDESVEEDRESAKQGTGQRTVSGSRVRNPGPSMRPPIKSTQDEEQYETKADADCRPAQPLRRRVCIPRGGVASSNPVGEWEKRKDRECNRAKACWRNSVGRNHRVRIGEVDVK